MDSAFIIIELDNKANIDEKELAYRCSHGDPEALTELYNRYATKLYSLCSRYVSNPSEGNDLMHDTMLKAFERIKQYRYVGKGSLYAWLSRVAVNLAIDRLRKGIRMEMVDIKETFPDPDGFDPSEACNSIPIDELQLMIQSLPDSKRVVFNMYCIEGYSHKEIAQRLGISEKASSSVLSKAKRMLSKMINDYYNRNA